MPCAISKMSHSRHLPGQPDFRTCFARQQVDQTSRYLELYPKPRCVMWPSQFICPAFLEEHLIVFRCCPASFLACGWPLPVSSNGLAHPAVDMMRPRRESEGTRRDEGESVDFRHLHINLHAQTSTARRRKAESRIVVCCEQRYGTYSKQQTPCAVIHSVSDHHSHFPAFGWGTSTYHGRCYRCLLQT